MKLAISPLTHEGVAHVIAHMSEEDRAEVIAAGIDPIKTFITGMEQSPVTGAYTLDGEVLAVYGCMPDPRLKGTGIPWMIATAEFRDHPRDVAELSMPMVESMHRHFHLLHNLVHCKHAVAQRWLTWLGFEISDEPSGPGNQFFYFHRYGDQHHV